MASLLLLRVMAVLALCLVPVPAQIPAGFQEIEDAVKPYLRDSCLSGFGLIANPDIMKFVTNSDCTDGSESLASILEPLVSDVSQQCSSDDQACITSAVVAAVSPQLPALSAASGKLCQGGCYKLIVHFLTSCLKPDVIPGDLPDNEELFSMLDVACDMSSNNQQCGPKVFEFIATVIDEGSATQCTQQLLATGCPDVCKEELEAAKTELGDCWSLMEQAAQSTSAAAGQDLPPLLDPSAWTKCGMSAPTGSSGRATTNASNNSGHSVRTTTASSKKTSDTSGNPDKKSSSKGTTVAIAVVALVCGCYIIGAAWLRFVKGKRGLEQLPFSGACFGQKKPQSYNTLYEVSSDDFDEDDDEDAAPL